VSLIGVRPDSLDGIGGGCCGGGCFRRRRGGGWTRDGRGSLGQRALISGPVGEDRRDELGREVRGGGIDARGDRARSARGEKGRRGRDILTLGIFVQQAPVLSYTVISAAAKKASS